MYPVRRSGRLANKRIEDQWNDDEEVIDLETPEWEYLNEEFTNDDPIGDVNVGQDMDDDFLENKKMERKDERVVLKEKLKALVNKRVNNKRGVGGKGKMEANDEESKKEEAKKGAGKRKKVVLCEKVKRTKAVDENGNNIGKNVVEGVGGSSDDDFVDSFVGKRGMGRKKMDDAFVKPKQGPGMKTKLDRIQLRNAPGYLFRVITQLTPRQKQDVRDIGFGDILDFKISSVPKELGYWLLDKFDADTCSLNINGRQIMITAEVVRNLLGVPMGEIHINARNSTDFRSQLARDFRAQFGTGFVRIYNSHVADLIAKKGSGWMFKINFLVLFFSTVGELNLSNTVNQKFLHCINTEDDIRKMDWCTYIVECLIKTKRSWKQGANYNGPIVLLLVLFAHSETPIKIWSTDMLKKLEADMLHKGDDSDTNVGEESKFEASDEGIVFGEDDANEDDFNVGVPVTDLEGMKKYASVCLKEAGELLKVAEEVMDKGMPNSPQDSGFQKLKELRDQLIAGRKYSKQPTYYQKGDENDTANDNFCTPKNGVKYFQMTQMYGSPTGYLDLCDKVWDEWHMNNDQVRKRMDFDEVSDIDLNVTQPPATQGKVVGNAQNEKSVEEELDLLDSIRNYVSQEPAEEEFFTPDQTIGVHEKESNVRFDQTIDVHKMTRFGRESKEIVPAFIQPEPLNVLEYNSSYERGKSSTILPEVLSSPYVVREVSLMSKITPNENIAVKCFFSARLPENDIVFKTSYVDGPRSVLESLYPGVEIASGAINLFTHILNEAEKSANVDDVKRLFCHTDMLTSDMKGWDYNRAVLKFSERMEDVLRKSKFKTTNDVDMVFFPVLVGNHFILMCMNLKAGLVQVFDNIESKLTDIRARYGLLPLVLLKLFLEYMLLVKNPKYDQMVKANGLIMELGCNTTTNFVDCGVFVMRHMETFKGNGDCCGLSSEGEEQNRELVDLRRKYVAKILLADCNLLKKEFESEVHEFKRLPVEDRYQSEDDALKNIKGRVQKMTK